MARKPHIHQIRGTNYTTREYCQSKGITDDTAIKKIQWRINTYIRKHTVRETTEELIRLVSFSHTTQKARTHKACGETHEPDQPCKPIDGIRPWQGTKKEREIVQRQKEAREAATSKMITQQQNGETATKAIDQRELLKDSEWMNSPLKTPPSYENLESMLGAEDPRLQNLEKIRETSRPNAIENAITQYAEAIQTVNRRKKELAEAQNALNRWAEVTTNLLNGETSSERANRFNKVNNT